MDPSAPRLTDRIFFAIYPPGDVASQIAVLARDLRVRHGLKARAHAPERSHVTLVYLGDHAGFPEDLVQRALHAAATVRAAPFDVKFDRAASFLGRARNLPFVLQGGDGVAEISAMRERLRVALVDDGVAVEPAFTPHVTLLYDDKAVVEQPIPPLVWTVTEFVLVRSRIGRAVHERLGVWPLG